MKELEDIFKGMASSRRIDIIKLLFPDRKLSVGDIAGRIGLSLRSTSKHLIKLEKSGYLKSRQKGFYKIYRINPKPPRIVGKLVNLVHSCNRRFDD